jgi:crotonobetainyl-CoA:carnitine CoA-transferase CaiB-like acyl-CoA transferase
MRPLDGIHVLELGQVIAGTYGTQFLADYGAEVVKVEPPRGDLGRNPATGDVGGMSSLFASMNRNKRSIVLDLRVPDAKEVLLDLVRWADVVIENFRPGTLERLGISESVMRQANPRLIFASVTGFGESGPYRDAPSFDLVHQAMSGWMSTIGEPDGPPGSVPIPIADILAGFYLTHGILAALLGRERTGVGGRVDTAMLDVMVTLLTYQAAMYLNRGVVPPRRGTGHEYHVPWQAYATADGYVVVAPREEVFWRALCGTIGRPDLAEDPRFIDAPSRRTNREALAAILEPAFRERTTADWLAAMERDGVPAAPVRTLDEALSDPILDERGLVVSVEPTGADGPIRVMGNPIRFDGRPLQPLAPPPGLGEHTREILSTLLGYPDERVDGLLTAGAAVAPKAPDLLVPADPAPGI